MVHLANFNSNNIGNGALIYGTERVLREDASVEIEFKSLAWDDYTFQLKAFDMDFVDFINSTDGLLVGGAVTFGSRSYLKNTGMRLDLPLELWPKIIKPIIFYGVSYRVWKDETYLYLDKLKEVMKYIFSNKKILFAVRNDGTKEFLEQLLGYSIPQIFIIPDPALFVPTKECFHPEIVEGKKNVILSLNNEDMERRYNVPFGERIESDEKITNIINDPKLSLPEKRKTVLLAELASSLEKIVYKYDINLILCPHYLDDLEMNFQFFRACKPVFAHQKLLSTSLLKLNQTQYFYDLYKQVDMSISMRVHSMSPSIGLNTPMLALTSQGRMTEFMDNIDLQENYVDIFSTDFKSQFEIRFDKILNSLSGTKQLFSEKVELMRRDIRCFNKMAFSLLDSAKN